MFTIEVKGMKALIVAALAVLTLAGCEGRTIWEDGGKAKEATTDREVWDSNGKLGERKIWNNREGKPVVQ